MLAVLASCTGKLKQNHESRTAFKLKQVYKATVFSVAYWIISAASSQRNVENGT